MSEDRAKEIIAEKVAKDIVENIGDDLAGALVEYANLVKELAADLTDEQLEDSGYIKSLLGEQLPNWDWEDWYELLKNVRREKYKNEHEEKTAENIFNDMPYFGKSGKFIQNGRSSRHSSGLLMEYVLLLHSGY